MLSYKLAKCSLNTDFSLYLSCFIVCRNVLRTVKSLSDLQSELLMAEYNLSKNATYGGVTFKLSA